MPPARVEGMLDTISGQDTKSGESKGIAREHAAKCGNSTDELRHQCELCMSDEQGIGDRVRTRIDEG